LEKIIGVIYKTIDELNEQRSKNDQISKHPDTILYDKNGMIDSLGFINLLVTLENNIEENFGKTVSLTNEDLSNYKENPFKSISTLTDYLAKILQ
jgi:D-alanine--poly(phosphoribitol) ligase subunit 2